MDTKKKFEIDLAIPRGEKPKYSQIVIRCSQEEKQMIANLVKSTGASSAKQLILHLLKQINDKETNS